MHAQDTDGVIDGAAPVPILAAVDVTVGGGSVGDEVRGAAGFAFVEMGERITGSELAAPVQRQDLFETEAGAFGDATQFVGDAREIGFDDWHPARRALLDLRPGQAGGASEGFAIEGVGVSDLRATRFPILPPPPPPLAPTF